MGTRKGLGSLTALSTSKQEWTWTVLGMEEHPEQEGQVSSGRSNKAILAGVQS